VAEITGKQRRYLRALAHQLQPLVIIGQRGLTEALVQQVDAALTGRELIKVKLISGCSVSRKEAAERFAAETGCEVAGVIGHTLILYRPRPEDPKIRLPGGAEPSDTGSGRTES